VRAGGALLPTPRAEALHEAVRDVIETVERRILPVASFDPASARREFVIAMSDLGEVVALPALMEAFKLQAPACTLRSLRLANAEIEDALESGRTDLGLGNVYEPRTNIYQQTLYLHDYAVLAWRAHPRLKRGGLTLERYLAEPHLVVETGSDEHLRSTGLAPRGIRRKASVTVGGLLSVPWLLPGTELLATVPTHLARVAAQHYPLRVLALPFEVPAYAIKTYWHPRAHSDAGHRWFRELVYEVMRRYPQWAARDAARRRPAKRAGRAAQSAHP
jgi:DNA-binding transcriptional LysR family regulator